MLFFFYVKQNKELLLGQGFMFVTLKKRLALLEEMKRKIADGEVTFDPDKANFGFRRLEQLFPVAQDEIKGYPCMASNRFSDPVKFGIKVIPLESKYEVDTHPCTVEVNLLKEFSNLVSSGVTPHCTHYFTDLIVPNKKRALTKFPLKSIRRHVHKFSKVLVAEFVAGGSIEEWYQEQPNISEAQWKYIIWAICWTLHVLQSKYQFLHNDFHFGNILVDTTIDPREKDIYQYRLVEDGKTTEFNVPNVGLLPKLWDFEYARTFAWEAGKQNDFFKGSEENIPQDFNPHYDLHSFLTSVLDLRDIPENVVDFIKSIYPVDVIPQYVFGGDEDTGSSSSGDSRSYTESSDGESRYNCYEEEFYRTDESSMETDEKEHDHHDHHGSEDHERRRARLSDKSRTSSRSSSHMSDEEEEERSEYLLGDRLLNGSEKSLELPTPRSVLSHPYFAEYKRPVRASKGTKKVGGARTTKKTTRETSIVVFTFDADKERVRSQPPPVAQSAKERKKKDTKKTETSATERPLTAERD